jgi:hypothetical protein
MLTAPQREIPSLLNRLTAIARQFKLKAFCDRTIQEIHGLSNVVGPEMAIKATEQIRCDLLFAPQDLKSLLLLHF